MNVLGDITLLPNFAMPIREVCIPAALLFIFKYPSTKPHVTFFIDLFNSRPNF